MMRVRNMIMLVVMMISMSLCGVIVAVAISEIALIVVPVVMSALRKRIWIAKSYNLLRRTNHMWLLDEFETLLWLYN